MRTQRTSGSSSASVHALAIGALPIVTFIAFSSTLHNGFVNWDDPVVIVNNPDLGGSHVVRWAFTTTLVGHYQPLAWMLWSGVKSAFGLSAHAFHAASLLAHVLNTILVYIVAWRLTSLTRMDPRPRLVAAASASALFGLHPVRVEAVAWASAFPYVLSLALLLIAFLAYLAYAEHERDGRRNATAKAARYTISLVAYVASLLARATAVAFPLVLLLVDFYPLRRGAPVRRLLIEKLPFAAAALVVTLVESRAREIATLQDVSAGARMTMAAIAPFVYLGRTIWPVRLTPLDPLPIVPVVHWLPLAASLAALVAISLAAWIARRRWPGATVTWFAFVLLLAPVAGLTPSGLQATADRYLYVPGVVLALAAGALVGGALAARPSPAWRSAVVVCAVGVAIVLAGVTWRQMAWWHDSIALWTRVLELDPRNDIATYNLAIALRDAGREEEAMRQYEATLRLVPDHDFARQSLAALRARQAEHAADRGLELVRLGRSQEAVTELRAAYDANLRDASVLNALAFSLMDTGRSSDAVAVLKQGVERYPNDVDMAHNLARLLATAPDAAVRDGALALRLALDVDHRTGSHDPRALDTLAAAYAVSGRLDLARETARKALARAREARDAELERQIADHARAYAR